MTQIDPHEQIIRKLLKEHLDPDFLIRKAQIHSSISEVVVSVPKDFSDIEYLLQWILEGPSDWDKGSRLGVAMARSIVTSEYKRSYTIWAKFHKMADALSVKQSNFATNAFKQGYSAAFDGPGCTHYVHITSSPNITVPISYIQSFVAPHSLGGFLTTYPFKDTRIDADCTVDLTYSIELLNFNSNCTVKLDEMGRIEYIVKNSHVEWMDFCIQSNCFMFKIDGNFVVGFQLLDGLPVAICKQKGSSNYETCVLESGLEIAVRLGEDIGAQYREAAIRKMYLLELQLNS